MSVSALGLGDLSVRSSLGQPLHAVVTILDASAATASECFRLVPNTDAVSPLPQARLEFQHTAGQGLLHVRTTAPLQEPIVQFTIAADCAVQLQREYVVLLDPPGAEPQPLPAAKLPLVSAHDSAPPRPNGQARQATSAKPAGKARPGAASPSRRHVAPAPRLVLSGHHTAGMGRAELALRLDTSLPDLTRPHAEVLTPTDLSDENTALTRKLAYLETQLASLQKRNAELEAREKRGAAVKAPAQPPAKRPAAPEWPLYLLFAGLLVGVGGLAAWIRRRSRSGMDLPDDEWSPHPPIPMAEPARSQARHSDELFPGHTDLSPHPALDIASPKTQSQPAPRTEPVFNMHPAEDSTEVKDDILDQAEVFMAHGHGELAIHLLQEHLREAPDESPVPWLLLLDLLHRAGDSTGYAATAAQCRGHYNIDLSRPPVSQDVDAEAGPGLEAYSHVTDRLVQVWRSGEIDVFFRDLIYDNRGGTRVGFEPGAYRDILLLRAIAQEALPPAA